MDDPEITAGDPPVENVDYEAERIAAYARIAAGSKRPDVVNGACIRNGMTEEEIAVCIDRALTARGE